MPSMTQHDSSYANHDSSGNNGIMLRGNDAGGESACVSPIPMDPTDNEADSGSADANRNGGGVCGGKMMAIRVQMLDESITLFQVQVKTGDVFMIPRMMSIYLK